MLMCVLSLFTHVRLFATLWTAARQAPVSIGFSRQEYWSGLPCPPPEHMYTSGRFMLLYGRNQHNQKASILPLEINKYFKRQKNILAVGSRA